MTTLNAPQTRCAAQLLELLPWLRNYLGAAVRNDAKLALSLQELRILSRLKRFPGISLSCLAEDLGINKATASTTIDRMVRQGVVSREENPQNRREVILKSTRSGLSHLNKSRRVLETHLESLMDNMNDQELNTLQEGLLILRKMLQETYPQLAAETDALENEHVR